ncbi:MAG: citrate transporter [Lawsonibacter sp.]|jgi:Na+/H+ antiporter NhaD/arsenite permease-like protein|nr:citrate transporter [Lawsonibacter sp.]
MFTAQICAVVIFLVMFILLITERIPRQTVTLGCGLATLLIVFGLCLQNADAVAQSLSFQSFLSPGFWYRIGEADTSTGINWETIVFIAGMMVMVEGMAASGFFRWLCIKLARMVRFRPAPLFFLFMILSAGLSMFIDSITVIMFLAAVTAELARLLDMNPVPFILSEIFCANLGGSATMCGDPPNIIIGTSLGYSFFDFITNTGFIALASMLIVMPYFYFFFRRELVPITGKRSDPASFPDPKEAITSRRGFAVSCVIFAAAVVLLVTHAQTGLTVSTIGLAIAVVTLLSAGRNAFTLLRKIDYSTLLFFIGLFVAVSGLEYTGVLELLAHLIERVSGGNVYLMVGIIIWGSALASAFIDNIPFAATMIPVIRTLSVAQGVDLSSLAWALSMGTDIGGSATPIGASANVVGTSIAAKNGFPVAWGRYCRAQTLPTILVLVIATVIVFARYL